MYGAYGRSAYDMMTSMSYFSGNSQYGQASPHSPAAAYHHQQQQQQMQQQQQQQNGYMTIKTDSPPSQQTAAAVSHLFRNHFGSEPSKEGVQSSTGHPMTASSPNAVNASHQAAAMALAMGMPYNPGLHPQSFYA
jgi:hypothetical protein